jgi:hypothetical protein
MAEANATAANSEAGGKADSARGGVNVARVAEAMDVEKPRLEVAGVAGCPKPSDQPRDAARRRSARTWMKRV